MPHPAERLLAPTRIQAGVPLKEILDTRAISLIGESFAAVVPGFDRPRFTRTARQGLQELGILQRGAHIAAALAAELPKDFADAGPLVIAALGPPLASTSGNGLAPFFYLPHTAFIATHGLGHVELGMRANYELTRRFTAEYAVRPYLIRHQRTCLGMFADWVTDPDPHVRRLVSEGTRPRLPWAMRLADFQRDPSPVLPLLERLKDDPELYVRRSVANHLGDIAKDHPRLAFALAKQWIDEVAGEATAKAEGRRWLVRHALRLPAQQGDAQALAIRQAARAKSRKPRP